MAIEVLFSSSMRKLIASQLWSLMKIIFWILYIPFIALAVLVFFQLLFDPETNQWTVFLTDAFQGTSCWDCY